MNLSIKQDSLLAYHKHVSKYTINKCKYYKLIGSDRINAGQIYLRLKSEGNCLDNI